MRLSDAEINKLIGLYWQADEVDQCLKTGYALQELLDSRHEISILKLQIKELKNHIKKYEDPTCYQEPPIQHCPVF